ncbi:hypothetical protein WQ57_24175 [Mesobacillus campisalis]|uniref:Uncharacterized protein n=1 Tax=Mesobacillus campisalis TaxID=1408103 RepID=A0A0M2SE82_9BACI|nr:hypothetical protein [Mesobacillus campisalis]KKK33049.1 hypothetical protein WQ57_24175 [Mesobacillus campisalis]
MQSMKNEGGYALLTVMLTIVLFMILFMAFMGQAFSTMKQNRVIEKSSQSVALAEAGISYYHAEVKNLYEIKQETVYDDVKAKIDADRAAGRPIDAEYYKTYAADLMEMEIIKGLEETADIKSGDNLYKSIPVNGKPNDSIEITIDKQSIKYNSNTNEILLKFTSKGAEEGKISTLTGNMAINISNQGLGTGPDITFLPPKFNIVTEPSNVRPECLNPSSLSAALASTSTKAGCTQILLQEDKAFGVNVNNLENTLIYSNHKLTIGATSGNINKAENVKIFADSLEVKSNVNNFIQSKLETNNDAIFGNNLTIHYSNLYIGGNLSVLGQQFTLENSGNSGNSSTGENSTIFVRGTVRFPKATTAAGTIMCVQGDMHAETLTHSGELYIKGKLFVNGLEIPSLTNVFKTANTDPAKLKQKCGATFDPPELFIGWGENVSNNVIYN